jgi:hypothetical protein
MDTKDEPSQNITIAQKLMEGIDSGQNPAEIAALFDADLGRNLVNIVHDLVCRRRSACWPSPAGARQP